MVTRLLEFTLSVQSSESPRSSTISYWDVGLRGMFGKITLNGTIQDVRHRKVKFIEFENTGQGK